MKKIEESFVMILIFYSLIVFRIRLTVAFYKDRFESILVWHVIFSYQKIDLHIGLMVAPESTVV